MSLLDVLAGRSSVKELFDSPSPTPPKSRSRADQEDEDDQVDTGADNGGPSDLDGTSGDGAETPNGRIDLRRDARKAMLLEATVALQCILATVKELEQAHGALGARLQIKDDDVEKLREQLQERDAMLQALCT